METPSFTCLPPCQVKLPPWTGVTTTIDFPRVTVTDGAWKTTITRPPLVVSKWMFEPVKLRAGGGPKEEETSTSSTSRPTTTAAPEPEPPKPMATPNPERNVIDCFHKGRTEDHDRLSNSINSFCNQLHREKGNYILPMRFEPRPSPLAVGAGNWSPTDVYMRAIIKAGCDWHWSLSECTQYMLVTLDSCNCAGINAKQGGVLSNNCMLWMVDPNAGI